MYTRRKSLGGRSSSAHTTVPLSYPVLSMSDVLICLREVGVTGITVKELTNPKPDTVTMVYEHLLEHCMGKTRDELMQPHFAGLEAVEYTELHEFSIPRVNFFTACQRLLTVCRVYDFSIADLQHPSAKRLQRQLSAVINFAKFREERVEMFHKSTEEVDHLSHQLEVAECKREEYERKLEDEHAKREAAMPAIKEAQAHKDTLKATIAEKNKAQAVLRHETAELKAENTKCKEQLVAIGVEIAQERQECEKLEAMIVHSPERLKQEHAHMTEQLREEQETLQEVEEQHREMRTRLDRVAKLDKAMDKLSALLNETKAALAEKKQARKSVKALQDSMERHKDRIQELKGRKELVETAVQRVSERLGEFRPAATRKTEAAKRALAATKAELARITDENDALGARRDAALGHRSAVLKKREDMRAEHQRTIEEMMSAFHTLRSKVAEYHGSLRVAMA